MVYHHKWFWYSRVIILKLSQVARSDKFNFTQVINPERIELQNLLLKRTVYFEAMGDVK